MEFETLELASHLLDSCIFDEALSVLEMGLLRTPVELPTSKETAILMTLAAYPLSHLGPETVKTMAYNSVHRGTRDGQKTPGARATALLRRYLEFSKGSGAAPEAMKAILRSSLTDYVEDKEELTNIVTTHAKATRTSASDRSDWDDVAQVPVDRSRCEGVDSNMLRDVIPHHERLKNVSDHLRPILLYTKGSRSGALWSLYAYYLSCSGARSSAHLSAWATVRSLLHVIQDIVEADPVILNQFYENHNSLTTICDYIIPDQSRSVLPLFVGDVDFGPNFDPETIDHLREATFMQSMEMREKWVKILLDFLKSRNDRAEMYLLDRFTTFAARHPQVIPHIYPCQNLPMYYTLYIFQKYIKYCTQRPKHVIGAAAFLEQMEMGKEKQVVQDAMSLLEIALEDMPDRDLFRPRDRNLYYPVLFAFYGHAQLWVKLALGFEEVEPKEVREMLQKGRRVRSEKLDEYGEKDETVRSLCEQEENVLAAMVRARMIINKYL